MFQLQLIKLYLLCSVVISKLKLKVLLVKHLTFGKLKLKLKLKLSSFTTKTNTNTKSFNFAFSFSTFTHASVDVNEKVNTLIIVDL